VDTEKRVHLEFIFPNLWQNFISEDVRIVAAFTPVDEENTVLYLRFYQRFLRLPVLGKLIAQAAMPMNVYIAHQDRRVVVTHQPQPSSMELGEKLIQGDSPIIAYRKRRAELKALAEA
jgi:phenylpropionate dioxygenase-like ring-hydroxylating dioxygenase large terminal subunit